MYHIGLILTKMRSVAAARVCARLRARARRRLSSRAVWADLRSDTVTRPTASMRAAMASAEVGDDVFGDDPTVQRLEAEAAAVCGHEVSSARPLPPPVPQMWRTVSR